MRTALAVCFFLVLVIGVVGSASAINFSGFVQDSTGNPVAGITVYQTENLSKFSNPSAADGSFTVAGLPSGTDFSLKFDGTLSYAILYSKNYNRTANASGTGFTFTLATPLEIADWYTKSDPPVTQISTGGTIRGRVVDSVTDNNIGGAKVTYTSSLGNTYPVYYYNGTTDKYVAGQATFANGRFFIFNVADGDTVTVTASKTDWTFNPITFQTHSGTLNVSRGSIGGKTPVLYLPLILSN
jgi:hypothetical protein